MEDNGIGITENDRSKLFQLFGYMDSTQKLNTKGIGLGLFITRKLIQHYNGHIVCYSEANHGSNFVFIVPLG